MEDLDDKEIDDIDAVNTDAVNTDAVNTDTDIDINNTSTETTDANWVFYIIYNKGCTYAGVSPDPVKRLRKHNGEIAGGAKYTLSKGKGWSHVCLISGFKTKIQALQFEWASKHVLPLDAGGIINRIKKLYILLNKAQWTSKSPPAKTVPLTIEWKQYVNCIDRTVPAYITDMPYSG